MIGPEIVITIVDVRSDRVRLGIAAPREVAIWRRELYETIVRNNLDHRLQTESEAALKRNMLRGGLG